MLRIYFFFIFVKLLFHPDDPLTWRAFLSFLSILFIFVSFTSLFDLCKYLNYTQNFSLIIIICILQMLDVRRNQFAKLNFSFAHLPMPSHAKSFLLVKLLLFPILFNPFFRLHPMRCVAHTAGSVCTFEL